MSTGDMYRPYTIPHITKREMDSGQKSGYYTTVLSSKEDWYMKCKYSKALCKLTASTGHAGKLICFGEC